MAQLVEQAGSAKTASTADAKGVKSSVSRMTTFLHALFFVFGFTVVFVLLGVFTTVLPYQWTLRLQQVGAVLLFVLALSMLGVFRWTARMLRQNSDVDANPVLKSIVGGLDFLNGLLNSERRVVEIHSVNKNWGFLSSFVIGLSFAAGWTPCIGPILGGILGLASWSGNAFGGPGPASSTVAQGATLLAIYSFGLGLPFLIVGAAFSRMSVLLRKLNRYMNIVGVVSGILLLFIAILLWTGSLASAAAWFPSLNDLAYTLEETVSTAMGGSSILGAGVFAAAPIAFVAGFLSFVSPCVLPLVPAYIGYLSGASINN